MCEMRQLPGACRKAERQDSASLIPIREELFPGRRFRRYRSEDNFKFYVTASEIEGPWTVQWPRVKETIRLCRRMGYHRISLAFCSGLSGGQVVCDLLEPQRLWW